MRSFAAAGGAGARWRSPRPRQPTSRRPPCWTTSSSCRPTTCTAAADGSPELERAADYIAAQFHAAGLQPGGEDGPGSSRSSWWRDSTIGEGNELSSTSTAGTAAALHAGHQLLPARHAGQRRRPDALGHARMGCRWCLPATASWCPSIGYDDYRRVDVHGQGGLIFSHEPQERLSGSRHERRAAGAGDDARRPRRRGAHPRRDALLIVVGDPTHADRPGRLRAVLARIRTPRSAASRCCAFAARRRSRCVEPISSTPGPPHRRRPGAALDGH